jgi:hypothetical protein
VKDRKQQGLLNFDIFMGDPNGLIALMLFEFAKELVI